MSRRVGFWDWFLFVTASLMVSAGIAIASEADFGKAWTIARGVGVAAILAAAVLLLWSGVNRYGSRSAERARKLGEDR